MKKRILILLTLTAIIAFSNTSMVFADGKTQDIYEIYKSVGVTKAETEFEEQIRKNPLDGNAYSNMTRIYIEEKYPQKAIDIAQKGIKTVPEYAYLYYNFIGLAYEGMGDFENAINAYSKSIEILPSEPPYYNRGKLYGNKGEFKKAISDFTKAIDFVSDYKDNKELYQQRISEIYWYRASAYAEIGEYLNAVHDYDSILQISPSGDPDVYKYRAMAKISVCMQDNSVPDSEKNIIFNSAFDDLDSALKGYRETNNVKAYQETFELNKKLLNIFTKK